jgi:methyltransferase (TIGR00027 family)
MTADCPACVVLSGLVDLHRWEGPAGRVLGVEGTGVSETGAASRTAMMAACARGWHLFSHGERAALVDWLAWPLVGGPAEALTAGMRAAFGEVSGQLATWMASRSRISEDWLAASGAERYVILGAGLDSFAWRQRGGVRVFEVDHPATQAWKRSRLEALGVPVPSELVWVPVDFEVESISAGLARAGLGSGPTFISWLGVTAYLSLEAIGTTLRGLPPCSLAVSYGTPEDMWQGELRTATKTFQAMALEAGEPLVSLLTPDQFADVLTASGFALVEDVGSEDVEGRYGLPALSLGNERIALARKDA